MQRCAFIPIRLDQAVGESSTSLPPSPSCLKHCTEDGWRAKDLCLWLSGQKDLLPFCLQGREGKEKDQPASKEEAKLLDLLQGLGEEADISLDGKGVSHKQCQYAGLAV